MEYYFCLDFLYLFLHYIHMSITFLKRLFIFLHFAKNRMSNAVGVKIKGCKTQYPGS